MVTLRHVSSKREYHLASLLFREYAEQIGIDLGFQDFENEVLDLRGQYSRPNGTIYIAFTHENDPLGCVALRKLGKSICELKRMYVKVGSRGLGIGKKLLDKSIETGKALGYDKMRLDTLPTMEAAIGLYKKTGFYEIAPYRYNPIKGAKYFEIDLSSF